ncbi:MAG: XRE family transcriptional regulator [Methanomicrobiaceae archaeon]|uniref:Transcriptional regulator, xre family n=1 Tax=hydrocarbon metagenome TaxID=938273 RepID=A0A0W8FE90_9ZZZZ|nr:XRE family transcriptional regulator [Methanomicrobiaceae archaeon]MDD5418609.1 XRE family transcriptional regulator [Methanomicrobiaceae archaeon]
MAIAERLKMARQMRGLSQRELAGRAGVSANAISKYERGINIPGSGVLIRLSKALDVKIEYFLRPKTYHIKLEAPAFRRLEMSHKEEVIVKERVRDWLERYLEVEDLLDIDMTSAFRMPLGYPIQVSGIEEIERVAEKLRYEWNLGFDAIESLTDLLEDRGIKVGVVPAPETFEAVTFWFNSTPVVAVRDGVPGDRQRLSLAHELGHLMVLPPEDMDTEEGREKCAFRFAGAFLVPESIAKMELGERRTRLDLFELHLLKHKYGLSMQAWIYRARDLGIISQKEYHRLFEIFSEKNWRQREPGDQIPPEEPKRMKRLVMRAYTEGIISSSRASELFGESIERFCAIEEERHGGFPIELCH